MVPPILRAALALATLSAPALSRGAAAQSAGLLLGFADADSTVWLAASGTRVEVRRGAGLLVPRRDRFWRVGIWSGQMERDSIATALRDSAEAGLAAGSLSKAAADSWWKRADSISAHAPPYEMTVWTAPVGHDPLFPRPEDPFGDDPTLGMEVAGRRLAITFINGRCISLEEQYDVTATYTSSSTRYVVGTLDSVVAHGSDVPLADASPGGCPIALDSAAEARDWEACVRRARRGGAPGEEAIGGSDDWFYGGMEQSLGVVRGRGRWMIRRRYGHSGGVARGYFGSCDIAIPVPRAILGYAEQPARWAAVRRRVRDASDAFVSPRRDIVVVLTAGGRLRVFALHGASLAAQLADVPAPGKDVVAAEWAIGGRVIEWTRTLTRILAAPPPRVAPR